MVVEPDFDFLKSDDDILEVDVLEKVAKKTISIQASRILAMWMLPRDKHLLESLWKEKKADWKMGINVKLLQNNSR